MNTVTVKAILYQGANLQFQDGSYALFAKSDIPITSRWLPGTDLTVSLERDHQGFRVFQDSLGQECSGTWFHNGVRQ